jgi:hypothetical protein
MIAEMMVMGWALLTIFGVFVAAFLLMVGLSLILEFKQEARRRNEKGNK